MNEWRKQTIHKKSGIELLKIFAILLIVTNHVVQTLSEPNNYISYQDYILDISMATRSVKLLFLSVLQYSGNLGNTLFFVCSAWFLLDKRTSGKRKLIYMAADVWMISFCFLITVFITNRGQIPLELIIKELFPNTFANNWYITCYILFTLLYPFLNIIINKISRVQLFRVAVLLALLYVFMNYLKVGGLFFSSTLIVWVTIYFIMAYIKFYMCNFSDNLRANAIMAITGMMGNLGIVILTDILGLKFSFFADKLLYWNRDCSPFLIMAAIGIFNIAKKPCFHNKNINRISSFSLLIYIIHENLLVRTYIRPAIWEYIYVNYGYGHILIWIILQVLIFFMISLLLSMLYEKVLQKIVHNISDKLYRQLISLYNRLEKIYMKIN